MERRFQKELKSPQWLKWVCNLGGKEEKKVKRLKFGGVRDNRVVMVLGTLGAGKNGINQKWEF